MANVNCFISRCNHLSLCAFKVSESKPNKFTILFNKKKFTISFIYYISFIFYCNYIIRIYIQFIKLWISLMLDNMVRITFFEIKILKIHIGSLASTNMNLIWTIFSKFASVLNAKQSNQLDCRIGQIKYYEISITNNQLSGSNVLWS